MSFFSLKRLCLAVIRVYWGIPFFWKPRCRFWPTCSRYAYEAVDFHGPARGLFLGIRRILRCHPFGGHGFDPVPGEDPRG